MEKEQEALEFSMSDEEAEEVIEAILFAAGYPLEFSRIAQVIGKPLPDVKRLLLEMKDRFDREVRGIQLVLLNQSAQLCTKEKYEDFIRLALGIRQRGRLSAGCLEVLAIIAYNQPVTKALIEQIRGTDSGYAIATLTEKSLIEVKGKLDVPGKPNLYGTTLDFLRVFGIENLHDLPQPPKQDGEQIKMEGI
jgi:segregation and condensation protein B